MTKFDIITVGGAVIDAFLYTGLSQKNGKQCYPLGSKLLIKNLEFSTGGGGTNTSTSFSKLGLKTGFLGKLGNDENGNVILRELKENKISFLGNRGDEPTGYSVILDSKEHERTILVYKGANDELKSSEVNLDKLDAKWFYFSSMSGQSLETQKKMASYLNKKGAKITYNPSSYLTKNGAGHIKEILKNTEILILNDKEARDLVPRGNLFNGLHSLGPNIVCVTYGPRGNSISDKIRIYHSKPHKIKIVERTGAGDAFASGFVAGYIKTNNINFSIQCGSLNAESVIQIRGAKNGLLTWKEILHKIKSAPVKIY